MRRLELRKTRDGQEEAKSRAVAALSHPFFLHLTPNTLPTHSIHLHSLAHHEALDLCPPLARPPLCSRPPCTQVRRSGCSRRRRLQRYRLRGQVGPQVRIPLILPSPLSLPAKSPLTLCYSSNCRKEEVKCVPSALLSSLLPPALTTLCPPAGSPRRTRGRKSRNPSSASPLSPSSSVPI